MVVAEPAEALTVAAMLEAAGMVAAGTVVAASEASMEVEVPAVAEWEGEAMAKGPEGAEGSVGGAMVKVVTVVVEMAMAEMAVAGTRAPIQPECPPCHTSCSRAPSVWRTPPQSESPSLHPTRQSTTHQPRTQLGGWDSQMESACSSQTH